MSLFTERRKLAKRATQARKVKACRRSAEDWQAIKDDRRAGERERWELRGRLRKVTTIEGQKYCGLPGRREDSSVTLRVTEGVTTRPGQTRTAGFAGLVTCGKIWSCPFCSRKIGAARATELQRVMGHYLERGGHAVMVTLTLRHRADQELAVLWNAVTQAWAGVTSGVSWQAEKKLTDLAGWVRATEITHGFVNGWHPHLHVVMIFETKPSPDAMNAMIDAMWSRWRSKVVSLGLDAPERDKHGLDVRDLDYASAEGKLFESVSAVANYVAKGLSMEATLGQQKQAKNGNRTTMELLRDALTRHEMTLPDGSVQWVHDTTALALWHEYEQASKGRRQLEWSRGKEFREVRRNLADTTDQSDDEIAAAEMGTADDDVAVIPADSWRTIAARAWELKLAAEEHGREGAWRWLDAAGVVWWRPNAPVRVALQQHGVVARRARRWTGVH